MAKMTDELIIDLYNSGKDVYEKKTDLDKASNDILRKYTGIISKSSADFYIVLYEELISGKGSTWNQNSALLVYFVENIAKDHGITIGNNAYTAGMKFARLKSRKKLQDSLKQVADKYGLMEIQDNNFTESDVEIKKKEGTKGDEISKWVPSPDIYSPNISKDQWIEIIHHNTDLLHMWGGLLAAFFRAGETTCTELAEHYGRTAFSISGNVTQLAKRIYRATNCPLYNDGEKDRYWYILLLGRESEDSYTGSIKWKLRPELYESLMEINIMRYEWKIDDRTMEVTSKEAVDNAVNYIRSEGFSFDDKLIYNFYLSLKSKPFVILAGTSGTGKTRLVRLFAEAIGAKFMLIPVRPDWSDSSDLFGHLSLNEKFVPGQAIDFIREAMDHPWIPYMMCLDEMNLARVEYYMSDILSVIEARDYDKDGCIITDLLVSEGQYGNDSDAADKYGKIIFPENLYIVGTVNMDETTFPFSKKVLDRANTIEFNEVELIPDFTETEIQANKQDLPNSFLISRYIRLLRDCKDEAEYASSLCTQIQSINEKLKQGNFHIGYRVRDEIVFYMLNNKEAGLLDEDEAFDNELMQKILPRIQGSAESVKRMLCELFKEIAGDYQGYESIDNTVAFRMEKFIADGKPRYPRSAAKIAFMVRRFEEDGFTSYWL